MKGKRQDDVGDNDELRSKKHNTNRPLIIRSRSYGMSNAKKVLVDIPDNFVHMVNSLEADESYKFLTFNDAKIFQFPRNRIYIRDCYYEMFEDICQIISEGKYSNIVITGQPGVGKTSFIYILLYFFKNISSFTFNDNNEKEYLKLIKRKNEIIKYILSKIIGIDKENPLKCIKDIAIDLQSLTKCIDQKEFLKFIKNEEFQTIIYQLTQYVDENEYLKLIKDEKIKEMFDKLHESDKKLYLGLIKCYKDIEMELKRIEKHLKKVQEKGIIFYNRTGDKNKGFNYYILDDIFKISDKKYKDIYICKGKRNGSQNDKKIYLLKDNTLQKVIVDEGNISDSIIIVDTFNGKFGSRNKIISISAPDIDSYSIYKDGKKLYFDSLSDVEIKDWYNLCINSGPAVDDSDDEFLDTRKRFGNIPRLIYYHYIYKSYEKRIYWDYYKQLIESVVGTDGYNYFVDKYMSRDNLPNNDLSNIILKYDLELEFDIDLLKYIYKPKEHLKFISKDVEEYIVFKFLPIKNEYEYKKLKDRYKSVGDDYMKRMAFKQIIAYELSTGKIKLLRNGSEFKDKKFRLNYDKQVSIYCAEGSNIFVYYLLDESNFFDLVIDGVFIKVLLDGESINTDKTKIKNSIKV